MADKLGGDALTESVVEKLTKGYNIEQVAKQLKIPVDDVFRVWNEYCSDRRAMPREQQWLLHLLRLEDLLTKANNMIDLADSDPKAFEATVKILERIEELQNLNLSRKQEAEKELVTLTKQQVGILFEVFAEFQQRWQDKLTEAFEKKRIADIKGEVLDEFDNTFNTIKKESLEAVNHE